MLLSDWEINVFFWEPRKQISVPTTGTGDYMSFITICLDLDLTCYYYALQLPRQMEKTRVVLSMLWFLLFCEIEGRGKKAVRCISIQHLCPGQENSLPFTQLLQASSFFCSLPACWRHHLLPRVQLSFPSCMYYRQRQMETWNCWPQLLDQISIFCFFQGSCILQNSSVPVSWYVTLEHGF